MGGEEVVPRTQPTYVMPLASVLVSASVGLLTFLSYGTGSANTVFNWLVNVASVASLQSWAGMLLTYIRSVVVASMSALDVDAGVWFWSLFVALDRWHQGTVYYERKHKGEDTEEAKQAREQIAKIKEHRQWGQPYVRLPFSSRKATRTHTKDHSSSRGTRSSCACWCSSQTDGAPARSHTHAYTHSRSTADRPASISRARRAVFVHNGWRIADVDVDSGGATAPAGDSEKLADPVSLFLSSYVPLVSLPRVSASV